MYVVRCKNILPEYLYLYLTSDTAKCVFEIHSSGTVLKRLYYRTLCEFPIIVPKLAEQQYIAEFEMITSRNVRIYQKETEERIKAYFETMQKLASKKAKAKNVEDILNIEIAKTIKAHNEDQLRSFLTDDLQELNICYRNKAYKATLILAGSILEAVLIDWLSEIKGVDYFEEDYYVKDRRTGKDKKAELIDYINEIKYIEKPHWMEEAEKAHIIRKKRNLVHAKLCMKSNDVNEEVCKEVIGYLRDVLKTRGVQ